MEEVELPIGGMTCAACARTVERQLGSTDGVEKASVNFATHTALVRFDAGRTGVEKLVTAVEDVGYEVPVEPQEIAQKAEALALRKRFLVGLCSRCPCSFWGCWSARRWSSSF